MVAIASNRHTTDYTDILELAQVHSGYGCMRRRMPAKQCPPEAESAKASEQVEGFGHREVKLEAVPGTDDPVDTTKNLALGPRAAAVLAGLTSVGNPASSGTAGGSSSARPAGHGGPVGAVRPALLLGSLGASSSAHSSESPNDVEVTGAQAQIANLPPKERAALWQEFKRSMNSPKAQHDPQVTERWKQAMQVRGTALKGQLMAEWLAAGKNELKMSMRMVATRTSSTVNTQKEGWMTRDQLLQHYCGNAAVADRIIAHKATNGQFMAHPEAPDLPEATLYNCLQEISRSGIEGARVDGRLEAAGQVEGGHAAQLTPTMVMLAGNVPVNPMLGWGAPLVAGATLPAGAGLTPAGFTPAAAPTCSTSGVGPQFKPKAKAKQQPVPKLTSVADMADASTLVERVRSWNERLVKDFMQGRTVVVRLKSIKHQNALCESIRNASDKLDSTYQQLVNLIKDPNVDVDSLKQTMESVMPIITQLYEDIDAANAILKNAGPKTTTSKKRKAAYDEDASSVAGIEP
jgi:hypothetical protein